MWMRRRSRIGSASPKSTVEKLVRTGRLPKARDVFGFQRWKWSEIEALIERIDSVETDAFMERLSA